jgi:hypothetical protein
LRHPGFLTKIPQGNVAKDCSLFSLETSFISISDAQRTPLPQARWVRTVYHAVLEELPDAEFRAERVS